MGTTEYTDNTIYFDAICLTGDTIYCITMSDVDADSLCCADGFEECNMQKDLMPFDKDVDNGAIA